MNIGKMGTGTAIDQLLGDYFPSREGDFWHQAFESETDVLLAALLLEMKRSNGDDPTLPGDQRPDQQEAEYFTTEEPLPVDSTNEDEQSLNWEFPAKSVTLWGFTEPIYVSFRESGEFRKIPLTPSESPFTVAPEGGLGASCIWVRKANSDTNDTEIKILALQ
ncbi:hypothetical protein CWS96_gp01 [Saline Natrinema sp. J7-1 virus 1]|uniref:Uncharacterized protein n=1 Tax=Saline Natrinema sp. J7-1 virus 1 TaxID=2847285 RepID=A0AAE9VPP3_9VIRU|nr:hypothetical protein CWS96_gp01 [Saline Natrinema sp. J7-1 virus 1]WBE14012.1 hypothetical protein [Saline Natrinema sp. J7-1 virus 1]